LPNLFPMEMDMAGKRVACDCGATVRAATDAELIAQVRAHAQQVHGMQLSDEQILAMAEPE